MSLDLLRCLVFVFRFFHVSFQTTLETFSPLAVPVVSVQFGAPSRTDREKPYSSAGQSSGAAGGGTTSPVGERHVCAV